MSRDWMSLWIDCASDETLDEFVARTEADEARANNPFYQAVQRGMQNDTSRQTGLGGSIGNMVTSLIPGIGSTVTASVRVRSFDAKFWTDGQW